MKQFSKVKQARHDQRSRLGRLLVGTRYRRRRGDVKSRLVIRVRVASFVIFFGAMVVLSNLGCTTSSFLPAALPGHTQQGLVRGGQEPVSGGSIQLYAVGTNGIGAEATPLLTKPVTTDASGGFSISGLYTCPSASTQVYLVAMGGNPGSAANIDNHAIALMDALGSCGAITPETQFTIDEVTTVAAVWALAPYMHSVSEVGTTPTDVAGLNAAFALAANFTDSSTGAAPGNSVPSGYEVPTSTINTAADVLAGCINSAGGTAGDSSPCGKLFTYAEAADAHVPTNVVEAALAIVDNPEKNVEAIYGLLPAPTPFEPTLAEPPPTWAIALTAPATTPYFQSSKSTRKVIVSIGDATSSLPLYYTTNGTTPNIHSTLYTAPISVTKTTMIKAVAVTGRSSLSAVASETFAVTPAASGLVFDTQPHPALTSAMLSPAITVSVLDENGNLFPTATTPVTIALGENPSGATLTGSLSATPVAGIATFSSLSLPAAGTYTLVASSAGVTSATSSAFRITQAPPTLTPVPAKQADAFVDSIGMNVHFNYYGSIYTNNTPLMIASLQALGVRHLRDAMCWQGASPRNTYYLLHQLLGSLGFKTAYTAYANQPMSQVTTYPSLVPDMEAIEPANEWDNSGDANWVAEIIAQQTAIYNAYKASSQTKNITILGPSLAFPTNAAQLGDVGSIADAGNLHGYFGGYNPGSSNANPSMLLGDVQPNTPSKPVWVTETGYFAVPGPIFGMNGVTPAVQAVYSPRSLLEYSNAGASRTYLYELADDWEPGEDATDYHWALLNSDGTPKPAFGAVASLLNLLTDKGPAFTPGALAYALQDADATVHQALFQKRDGTWYLALWVEAQSYDFINETNIAVPTQKVTLEVAGKVLAAQRTQWDDTGKVVTTALAPSNAIALTVSDKIQVIKLTIR